MLAVEEWNEIMNKIINSGGDQATLVSLATQARDEYVGGFAELEAMRDERDKKAEEITRLTDTNRELYLRIGQQIVGSNVEPARVSTTSGEEVTAETITIKDIFKEEDNG